MNSSGTPGPQPTNGKDPSPPAAGSPPHPSPEAKPAAAATPVSRAPLNLGGTGVPVATPAPVAVPPAAAPRLAANAPIAAPVAAPPAAPRPVAVRPAVAGAIPGADRISGCKTFFTKLHPGAIDFLDEQINQWLKDNPSVIIKMTNTAVGEIQGKKTEANILLTVWYHGQATKSITHMG